MVWLQLRTDAAYAAWMILCVTEKFVPTGKFAIGEIFGLSAAATHR
jgi:hypothetical protein